ncbi:hypothetical protein JCM10450v2_005673 [Rhodotorula kratochvilovae]
MSNTTIVCGVNCACAPAPSSAPAPAATGKACSARESCTYAKEGKCDCGETWICGLGG